MSDQNQTPDLAPADAQGTAVESKKSFLGTGNKRILVIVGGLGLLAIIAGVVLALVLFVFGKSVVDDLEVTITPNQPVATESTATVEVATPADRVANSEVFTFRDIFEPLIVALEEETTTTASTTETDTANTTVMGTLYLTDIVYQDGDYVAVLSLDGVTYSLRDGERVGTSPWQVVTVRTDSVIMLYGDTQVVLTVGQGITK